MSEVVYVAVGLVVFGVFLRKSWEEFIVPLIILGLFAAMLWPLILPVGLGWYLAGKAKDE